jgi:hypothetical protein
MTEALARVSSAVVIAASLADDPAAAVRAVWTAAQHDRDGATLAEMMRDGRAWVDLAARVQLANAIDRMRAA